MLFAADRGESLLYSYFHEFHHELVKIKHLIHSGAWALQGSPEEKSSATLTFRQQLIGSLQRQSIDAAQRGGEHGARLYREAQYLMVALADEFFLHLLDWEGKEAWRKQLLEVKMFNSQAAGERVFDNLDTLLKNRDPITLDLARIYLIVLTLNFQGKYRDSEDTEPLNHYRRQLFFFITQREPSGLNDYLHYDPNKRIFPDAYAYTLDASKEKRRWLPSLFKWYMVFAVVGVGLLFSSTILWHYLSADIDAISQLIIEGRGVPPPPPRPSLSEFLREEQQLQVSTTEMGPRVQIGGEWFPPGAVKPTEAADQAIKAVIETLHEYPEYKVVIEGHTDSVGPEAYNEILSKRRAETIRGELLRAGIDNDRMVSVGRGTQEPLADNVTEEGRQQNRRVEIYFVETLPESEALNDSLE
ncbi:MAG: DotU family type IV/VI secretion system protein [Pseudomonadota bacterium]|nr:DotU family type IV/VI secretion system protein [Pseudomonadota bacterium]